LRPDIVELPVDRHRLAPIGEVTAAHFVIPGGHNMRVGASLIERLARLGEFDLFEAVRDENGDFHALQSFAGHDWNLSLDGYSPAAQSFLILGRPKWHTKGSMKHFDS
jgi:hypothetical protein